MPDYEPETGPSVAVIDHALTRIAERYTPTGQPTFTDLVSRRRRRTRRHAGAAFAVAVVAVGAVSVTTSLPFAGSSTDSQSTQPDLSGDVGGTLVSDGPCADLRVNAQWQGPGGPLVPIEPPPAVNVVTMPANSLLYLLATGSCIDQLRFHTDSRLVQGATSLTGGTFEDGVSVVVSHPAVSGTATLELLLDCGDEPACGDTDQPLATLDIDITASPDDTTPPDDQPFELGAADWTIATPPTSTDTMVSLVVEERACASGRSAEGRIVPAIEYTETAILVTVFVERLTGGQDCQGNPATPYDLELTEPVGDRAVIPGP